MKNRCLRNTVEYDRKVEIQKLKDNLAPDASGHINKTLDTNWEKYADAYAKVVTKGGREFWKVDRVEDTVDVVFWCPYSPTLEGVTPEMRIDYRGRKYNVMASINVDLADAEMQFQTRTVG